jgi:DNA replication protein DnaC
VTAFLKIDRCAGCQRELPWEWVPQIDLGGRILAGTGVWRSGLVDDLCEACAKERECQAARQVLTRTRRDRLIALLGGPKPFREFTFERYRVQPGNRTALEAALAFDTRSSNLCFWGAGGVGKTHLAYAIARRAFWQGRSVVVTTPAKVVRRLRLRPPEEEQHVLDTLISADVLVLDGLGSGPESPYLRQLLEEVLDGRDFRDTGGLVVASRMSPLQLIHANIGCASRVQAMCEAVSICGPDRRLEVRTDG